jgi:hypothetical protein
LYIKIGDFGPEMYSLKLLSLSPDICYCLFNRIKQILCSHNIFEVLFLLQQVSMSGGGNIRWKTLRIGVSPHGAYVLTTPANR